MLRKLVRSSMVVLALGFAACDDVPTTTNTPDDVSETEFDPSFDVSLPPDGGTCPDVFYEESKLLSNGITVTWTHVLAGFDYTEGEDYMADVNWSVDQGSADYVGFTTRNGPNTWTPKRDVDGMMSAGAAGDGTVPVTVSMMPMHQASEGSVDDDDDEEDDDEESAWAGKIGNGHFWLRLEIEDADGKVKRVKLGVNFHLEDPADGYGTNCPGDDGPVDPPVGNEPPVADAGPNQTVEDTDDNGSEDVVLDGSASMDPDGSIVSWSWSEGGSEIATGEMPTVAFAAGVHEVTLTVTDDGGATDADNVVITVEAAPPPGNEPPVADAGPNQTVEDTDGNGGEDIALDGSGSMDPDGSIVSWSWSEGGSEIATGETPIVAFAVGLHEVTLTVTDDGGATDTDNVVITVEDAPPPGISFTADIQPYFETDLANCVRCHSGESPSAGVSLDSYGGVIAAEPAGALRQQLLANHQDGPDDAGFVTTLDQWVSEGSPNN